MTPAMTSPGRLRIYLRLGRVSNLPTVWTNVLAGLVLTGNWPDVPVLVGLLVSLTLFYTGGMFLNDAFDNRFDAQHRPERPIPMGQISVGEVYGIGFGLLVLGILLLSLPSWWRGVPPSAVQTGAGFILAGLIT